MTVRIGQAARALLSEPKTVKSSLSPSRARSHRVPRRPTTIYSSHLQTRTLPGRINQTALLPGQAMTAQCFVEIGVTSLIQRGALLSTATAMLSSTDFRGSKRLVNNWLTQSFRCFGDKGDVEDITEADIISTVEFDQTGNYLATGDKGGRVVLFERNETKKTCEYKFHTEFQSHEPEFDYLKSLEIEEKINKIKWCKRQNASHYLLSTNDKTIKLWKVFEKSLKVVAENNLSSELTPAGASGANGGGPVRYPNQHFRSVADLKFPRMTHHDTVVAAVPRKVYANAHAYHINSISVNSDGETFISSDDLRINLWNLNIQDQSFNIVDIKPANMEELTEVITAAEFHPTSCNWFMYASSKGTIKLADMRQKALCDEHAKRKYRKRDPSRCL